MKKPGFSHYLHRFGISAFFLSLGLQMIILAFSVSGASAQTEGTPAGSVFNWTNLQGDLGGIAAYTDSNLIAPWGLALNPYTNVFWVVDNGTGVVTFYY